MTDPALLRRHVECLLEAEREHQAAVADALDAARRDGLDPAAVARAALETRVEPERLGRLDADTRLLRLAVGLMTFEEFAERAVEGEG